MLVTFFGMRRTLVAGTTLRAMKRHLAGFFCFNSNENCPDEVYKSNMGLNPKTSSSADVPSSKFDLQTPQHPNPSALF